MMTTRFFLQALFAIGLVMAVPGPGAAGEDTAEVALYDLSLFSYRIGMTYDESTTVRPFHRIGNSTSAQAATQTIGVIDSVQLAEITLKLTVFFNENHIHKIIGRFPPSDLELMKNHFCKAFGPGKDISKVIERPNGYQVQIDAYAWEFPGAVINLVRASDNDRYATASMLSRALLPDKTEPREQ